MILGVGGRPEADRAAYRDRVDAVAGTLGTPQHLRDGFRVELVLGVRWAERMEPAVLGRRLGRRILRRGAGRRGAQRAPASGVLRLGPVALQGEPQLGRHLGAERYLYGVEGV